VALDQTAMNGRRFPPPWTVEEQEACFVVRATTTDSSLPMSISRISPAGTRRPSCFLKGRGAPDRGEYR